MKKQIIAIVLGATAMLWSSSVLAYKGPNDKPSQGGGAGKAANCAPATAKITMEFNDVSALIEQGGSMWQNRATSVSAYEVPKGSGLKIIYAGALWMGGTDINGQLKLAGLTFRTGNDFWPGPLSVNPGSGTYDPSGPVGADAVRDFGQATIDPDQCLAYDKFYTIRKSEVIQYSSWWEACEGPNADPGLCDVATKPNNEVLNRIYAWPAHGDVSRGQDYWLAPFYDNPDGPSGVDGQYNPADGDTPWYDDILNRDDIECGIDRRISLFGDETHWWVFNDNGNIHGESNGDPIGMEIRAQAFAFATNDEVNRMTFYNYEMINRGTQTLQDTYFAQYIDADVGNYADDYTGCDVSRGLGYMFNGDNLDENNGGNLGYGENPPAIGCDFFEGPYQDADGIDNVGPYFDENTQQWVTPTVTDAIAGNGIVYTGIGVGYSDGIVDNERYGMRLFTYYTNGAAPSVSDPSAANQFYNYMSGYWADGQQMVYGGTGYPGSPGSTTTPSTYMFPGDSDPLHWATAGTAMSWDWSEVDTDGSGNSTAAADRRFVQSAGPFTLTPGAVNNITVGLVFGRGNDGTALASVEAMKRADTKAQALFDACFRILEPPYAPKLSIQELENELVLMLENPLGSNNYVESYQEEDKINIVDPSVDRFYRFEGYQIYQLSGDDASVADIGDNTKARLVAQCDIKNDIEDLINFEFDEGLGFSIPTLKVDAANTGIQHSFLLTEDAFAQGTKKLVNHKTYYYVAVAYAYNDMADLATGIPNLYNPNDPLTIDGQKTPYISSRLGYDGGSIKSVAGIPHNPAPEADGTIHNIEYGSGPRITRLDGFGNGGLDLELTDESKNAIITSGIINNPTYDYGKGPINVKVIDPLNVVDGRFELKFHSYNASITNAADTASWSIYRYDSSTGALIDSVNSDRTIGYKDGSLTIGTNNEQIIAKWGVSVQINQVPFFLPEGATGGPEARSTYFLGASLTYGDSSKRWLSGVADADGFDPSNWIRSGDYEPDVNADCLPNGPDYFNPCNYGDELNVDNEKEWAKILGGTVAPHRVVGYQSSFMPMAYYNYPSPLAARKAASISFLPSVDIVLTSDKSLWTRCPVIELGRESAFNVGGAQPGQMRNSPSVDKNGNPDGSGEGMGWFPGYAIDVESGARLYMAFGENSFLVSDNGADMIWNPTSRMFDGGPIMGGMHPIYVFAYGNKSKYGYTLSSDYPAYIPSQGEDLAQNKVYQDMLLVEANNSGAKRDFYGNIAWVAYPLLEQGATLLATDAKLRLRVSKEYKNFYTNAAPTGGPNGGRPMYEWNMDDIMTRTGSADQLASVLDMINIVPNPYYAYSEYEKNRLDTRVKITNLPERCTVRIFTTNGKLVRTFKKDSPITSLDWDLNNHKGIPVAGGVYLIHVEVPEIGERVLKFFGGMRQIDLQGI